MRPWVQAAIDVRDMDLARRIASMAVECGAEWVEVGTSLLYKFGYDAIAQVRAEIGPDVPIVADYKNPFIRNYTAEIAQAGANYVMYEGCYFSDESTVKNLKACEDAGLGAILTLLSYHVDDVLPRARKLEELGVKDIFIHRTLTRDGQEMDYLGALAGKTGLRICVTDDDFESALKAVDGGADWICFGKALFDADPVVCKRWIDAIHNRRD